jgi:hypothetical protein
MRTGIKLPTAALLAAMPLVAYAATDGAPHTFFLAAAAGGAVGGFLGALLACWLCKRRGSHTPDSKKY